MIYDIYTVKWYYNMYNQPTMMGIGKLYSCEWIVGKSETLAASLAAHFVDWMRMPQLLTPPFNHWLGAGLPTYGLIESEVIETTMRKGSKDEYIPRNAGEIVGNYRANQANGYTKTWTVHTEHDEFIGWLPGFSRLTKQLPASNAFMCFPNSYNF